MDTPDLIHVALNDGGGPMARLVPVMQVRQWLESPDFFEDRALWHEEWRGMTPAAVAPAGPGLLAVDVPARWVGYAIAGAPPFRWAWQEEARVPHDLALGQSWKEGRLMLKLHGRHDGDFPREAERVVELSTTTASLAEAVRASQVDFLKALCADGSSQPAHWRVSLQLRQRPPHGWACVSFFDSGILPASGDWAGFAQALVERGWDFSEAERVAWRRHLLGSHRSATLLDELLAARQARR